MKWAQRISTGLKSKKKQKGEHTKKLSYFLLLIAISLGLSVPALANALSLVSPAPADQQYLQTSNSPCVFGGSSCSNPAGFGYTSIQSNATSFNVTSPTYTGAQIISALNSGSFMVGIDVNQANQQEPTLVSFGEWINGVEVGSFSNASTSGTLALVNNGTGQADDLLTNFVSVAAGDSVYFTLNYTGANASSEEFFPSHFKDPDLPGPGASHGRFVSGWASSLGGGCVPQARRLNSGKLNSRLGRTPVRRTISYPFSTSSGRAEPRNPHTKGGSHCSNQACDTSTLYLLLFPSNFGLARGMFPERRLNRPRIAPSVLAPSRILTFEGGIS